MNCQSRILSDYLMKDKRYRVVLSEGEILEELRRQLSKFEEDVRLKTKEKYPLIGVVGILNGGLYLTVDVSKNLELPNLVEFCKVQLYDGERKVDVSKKFFKIEPDYKRLSKVDAILVVDDICSTGETLKFVVESLRDNIPSTEPIPIYTLTLILDATEGHTAFIPDYYLYVSEESGWFFGYGMDYSKDREATRALRCLSQEIE